MSDDLFEWPFPPLYEHLCHEVLLPYSLGPDYLNATHAWFVEQGIQQVEWSKPSYSTKRDVVLGVKTQRKPRMKWASFSFSDPRDAMLFKLTWAGGATATSS